ncbi:MAG: fumarylacetoacetase [Roseateles depolymerans]|uniref:Fumarylacetoacetase n=1 Tax=Roseateles depolymerans TaxID=76731 RepID=A0A2W5DRB5_9BURK|nr:MAG: fumarylacetoacetase [Roseateles depolymerans]
MNSPMLDHTHDPAARSWVEAANAEGTDFPLQNLPLCRFRRQGTAEPWRVGVGIGDQILDLSGWGVDDMNALMGRSKTERVALRHRLFDALKEGAPRLDLLPQALAEFTVPCRVGDYTDFYTGIHHARAVGALFRPDNPLLPNYQWVPIGYHGRSSSIVVSGTPLRRPRGQVKPPDATVPVFKPSERIDFELELGLYVGPGNALGQPFGIDEADEHAFGLGLLNDWSARDIQPWEYQPLGPFLAKNFGTTVSPWVVTMEALEPFRIPFTRPEGDPQPLPYLDSPAQRERGGYDINLEVWLKTPAMAAAQRLSTSNARHAYWTLAQMLTHHASNGCNLQPGDLLGTGTLSGPAPEEAGSLLELTQGGKQAISLAGGETRRFLQDGDQLGLRAYAEKPGFRRIGFGACDGVILPAP